MSSREAAPNKRCSPKGACVSGSDVGCRTQRPRQAPREPHPSCLFGNEFYDHTLTAWTPRWKRSSSQSAEVHGTSWSISPHALVANGLRPLKTYSCGPAFALFRPSLRRDSGFNFACVDPPRRTKRSCSLTPNTSLARGSNDSTGAEGSLDCRGDNAQVDPSVAWLAAKPPPRHSSRRLVNER